MCEYLCCIASHRSILAPGHSREDLRNGTGDTGLLRHIQYCRDSHTIFRLLQIHDEHSIGRDSTALQLPSSSASCLCFGASFFFTEFWREANPKLPPTPHDEKEPTGLECVIRSYRPKPGSSLCAHTFESNHVQWRRYSETWTEVPYTNSWVR